MKWTNKGHEFDEVFQNIDKLTGVYLFGAGNDGRMVKEILCMRYPCVKVLGFIDNNKNKQGVQYEGLPVYSLSQVERKENIGIIISFASEFVNAIDSQLANAGWEKGVTFFHYEEFLSVIAAYRYDEVFFSSMGLLPTTRCNLRCKACLNFTNYIKKFTACSFEVLKKEVDLFFSCVDYIGLLLLSGGEPFLYPNIAELICYINENYRNKIYFLELVTNGTVTPHEEIIKAIQRADIRVTVDDYREALSEYKDMIEKNMALLAESCGEKIVTRKYADWISLYPHKAEAMKETDLVSKFELCHVPWQEYRDGKLFCCNYASFAAKAGITEENDISETYDLRAFSKDKKKELIEFRLGYSEKGYTEFCKQCAGYLEINPYKVPAAEQEGR